MKLTAVKVLPLPVAIWMRARGRLSARDLSRFLIALICAGQRPSSLNGGISRSRERKVEGLLYTACASAAQSNAKCLSSLSHDARVSGRWKENTRREHESGSR